MMEHLEVSKKEIWFGVFPELGSLTLMEGIVEHRKRWGALLISFLLWFLLPQP